MRETKSGVPLLLNKGLLIRADGSLTVICPHCKGDVEPTAAVMKSLQAVTVLFFSKPMTAAKS
ncbi:hypothetical protein [Nevskia sp.]|uniref:hypothetical protein n=1 Tax=Nevskia sp. TaxID=1929292 RepID=UPI0025F45F82|nr:hypothetical protein [Nevskia sp.]